MLQIVPNVISNPKRPVRVERLHKEMERQGITDYKMWDSIHIPNKPKRTGISQAHKQIVRWALIEGMPEVCIFEDDIRFHAEDGWKYYLENKPTEEFDLYLGGVYRGEIDDNRIIKRFTGFHCYIVSERFYTTFLGVDENIDIDGALSGLGIYYCCYPFACVQHNGWSDNAGGNMDYDHLLKNRKIYGLNC